jgi:hypothetical protein
VSGLSSVQGVLPKVEMIHNFRSDVELKQVTGLNP